jgi:uncharacterized protein (UPF0261 family)
VSKELVNGSKLWATRSSYSTPSGVGGKSLERLSVSGELAGVIDVTTHELTDLIVDGVYSAGEARMTGAGAAGLPQVIVPGAIDHANFWVGHVPD